MSKLTRENSDWQQRSSLMSSGHQEWRQNGQTDSYTFVIITVLGDYSEGALALLAALVRTKPQCARSMQSR